VKKPLPYAVSILALLSASSCFAYEAPSNYKNSQLVNIRFSPLLSAIKAVNVEADIKLNEYFSAGPMYTNVLSGIPGIGYANIVSTGVRVNYHHNGTFRQGDYASAYVKKWESDRQTTIQSFNSAAIVLGHQWKWKSFNVNLEAGYTVIQFSDEESSDFHSGGYWTSDIMLGWAF